MSTTTSFAATTAARTTTAPTAALPAPRTTTPSPFALPAGETETSFRLPPFHYADPPACPPTLLALSLAAAEEELCRPWWAREVAPIALLGDNLGGELLCLCEGAGWARAGEAGVDVGAGVEADVRAGEGVSERVGGGNASLLATSRGAARPQRAREAHLPRGWQRGADWPVSADEQDDSEEEEEGSREGGDEEIASGEGGHDSWDVLDWDEGRVSREKVGALGQWQRLGLVPCREFYLD